MTERVFSMSAGLDASTVTPGSTAPDASRAVPTIDACANAADGNTTRLRTTRVPLNNRCMHFLRDRWYQNAAIHGNTYCVAIKTCHVSPDSPNAVSFAARMELRHLRYVVTLAETLHFGRAAERLHLSQPPLSHQVRQLEEELRIKLFHRTKRQVQLTEAGRMFVQEARVILAQAAHASNLASRMTRGQVGQLTVGVAGPADAPIFVAILRAFAARYPKVHIVLRNLGSLDQTHAINEGRLHVGFVALPIDEGDLTTETVLRQPIVIALPPEHPLAALDRVPLQAL